MSDLVELLAEIDALKLQLDALRPAENPQVLRALAMEYTYDSNRIEGNTLTLRETDLVVSKGLTIGGKSLREHLEATNHFAAVEYIREIAAGGVLFSEKVLREIHALVLQGIDRENAGRYRSVPVLISGSRHVPPQPWQVPIDMENYFRFFREDGSSLHPVILAAELHERLATIHPFIDGNGRTARLVMNLTLLRAGYPIVNIPGDTENRLRYYAALEECNLSGVKDGFHFLIAEFVKAAMLRLLAILSGAGRP